MSDTPERVTIADTTQASFGDVLIGAGNFWEREYTDAEGSTRTGPTAMLWLSVQGHPEEHERLVVYPGLEFDKRGMRFRVEELGDDSVTVLAARP